MWQQVGLSLSPSKNALQLYTLRARPKVIPGLVRMSRSNSMAGMAGERDGGSPRVGGGSGRMGAEEASTSGRFGAGESGQAPAGGSGLPAFGLLAAMERNATITRSAKLVRREVSRTRSRARLGMDPEQQEAPEPSTGAYVAPEPTPGPCAEGSESGSLLSSIPPHLEALLRSEVPWVRGSPSVGSTSMARRGDGGGGEPAGVTWGETSSARASPVAAAAARAVAEEAARLMSAAAASDSMEAPPPTSASSPLSRLAAVTDSSPAKRTSLSVRFGMTALEHVEDVMEGVADGVMRLIQVDDDLNSGAEEEEDDDDEEAADYDPSMKGGSATGSVAGGGGGVRADPILVVEYCTLWLNPELARLPELDFGEGKGLDR